MITSQHLLPLRKAERGQSTTVVALSLGVLLLLVIGALVLCAVLFTATTMEDYDSGGGIFDGSNSQVVEDVSAQILNQTTDKREAIFPRTDLSLLL